MKKLLIILLVLLGFPTISLAQKIGIKTNLLYDATSSLNLGVEFGIAPKWTLEIAGNYNPWTFSDNRKMKHWFVQPEARIWTCQRFNGHFFGIHALGGQYNWGGMLPWGFNSGKMFGAFQNNDISKYRYEGWLAGAGISYGYHWAFAKRWGLEFTLGAGYAYLKYNKYDCENCGDKLGLGHKNYIGPTKAGITLIFMIK